MSESIESTTTEVKTEKKDVGSGTQDAYRKETTVHTERTVEKERDPIVIVEEEK